MTQDHANLLLIRLSISPLLTSKQCAKIGKVTLEGDANALRSERGLGEVTVVGLAIWAQTDVATRREKVTDVKVTYEVGSVSRIITITKVSVDKQTIVEQTALKQTIDLHIVPSLRAWHEVCAK